MNQKIWIMNHYAGSGFFDRGGRHYNMAKHLKAWGHAPVIFCAASKHNAEGQWVELSARWTTCQADEIQVPFVFVAARSYTGNGKQRVLNMLDFYRNVKKAAKEYAAQHGGPSVIYASSVHPLTLVAGIRLAKKFGVNCICEVRDLWPESIVEYASRLTKKNLLVRLLYLGEKWIYKKADKLVFTAEGSYDYIREQNWQDEIPKSKVFYINNGADLELFRYNRDRYQVRDADLDDPARFKVVYAGSIRKVNNLGLLLDAAKCVQDPRVKFLIWGDGDELEALKQRAAAENIENVCFKGRVEKKYVPYIVSRADLNLAHNTPARLFRFGISFNKLFDYLAAGKPVLSDFPCPYNPAVQYGAGTQVEEPTPERVARAVEYYAGLAPEEYARYQQNAERAAEAYDFRRLTQKLLDVINA